MIYAFVQNEKGAYKHMNGKKVACRIVHSGIWQFFDETEKTWVDTQFEKLCFQGPDMEFFIELESKIKAIKNQYIIDRGSSFTMDESMHRAAKSLKEIKFPGIK